MNETSRIFGAKDKVLFTPGPLTTSRTVKQAMLRDLGSRDFEFIELVKSIRQSLLALGEARSPEYEAVLMQGSGTFAVESVISSVIPKDGRLLTIINGAYGRRISQMASVLTIDHRELIYPEDSLPNLDELRAALASDARITHVAVVHCETSTGILNPIEQIGGIARDVGHAFIVDAMSSFGAYPINLAECNIDFLVSSANKCIEGVPGFAFVLATHEKLVAAKGQARSLSLDLHAQWEGLESGGQFRFTPPTHALLAFHQALRELEEEGAAAGRARRYQANYNALRAGMRELGFREFLPPEIQGYIITAFHYPDLANFKFDDFYSRLNDKGYVIYPGKVSDTECFRIGNIGRIFETDIHDLIRAIESTLKEMKVDLRKKE